MMLPIEVVAQHYHGILRSVPSEPYLVGFSDLQMIALDAHLLGQAEFRTDPVVRLYQACFGRVPDSDGLDFWVEVYKITYPIETLANAFSASDEFQEQYAGLSNADIVAKMYGNILNRQGDDAGIAFWTNFLNDGGTLAQLVMSFSQSQEFVELARPYIDLFLRSAANGVQDYEGSLFEPGISGQVYSLTYASDVIVGTEGDDFFYSQLPFGSFQSSDILDGNGGWDTLWTTGSHTIAPTMRDIEVLQVRASYLEFDAANVTGLKEIWNVNSNGKVTFSNISLDTLVYVVTATGESVMPTLHYLDTDGGNDVAYLTISGGKQEFHIDKVEHFNIEFGANTGLLLNGDVLETVTIHGEGDLYLRVEPTETLAMIDASEIVGKLRIGNSSFGQLPPLNPLTIKGSNGDNDIRFEGEADMVIITQGGQDVIWSCAGANTITPGGGADTIYLEYGHTTLRYESLTDSTLTATDAISFFTHGRDKIDLTGLGLSLASQEVLEAAQAAAATQTSLSAALDVFAQLIGGHGAGYFSYGDYIYAFGNDGTAAFSSTDDLVIRLGGSIGFAGDDFIF